MNISRIFFLDSLYCQLLTCTSYFWNNETLLEIFGGRLSAPALSPWHLILAGLFFVMLFTLLKQIIITLKSSKAALPCWFNGINYNYFENKKTYEKLGGQMYLPTLRISLLHLTYVIFLIKHTYVNYLTAW